MDSNWGWKMSRCEICRHRDRRMVLKGVGWQFSMFYDEEYGSGLF